MAAAQRFRSAFNGFNREDVVRYIEYLNNSYTSQIQQLNTQLQNAAAKPADAQLQADLDAALAKIAELEAKLADPATYDDQNLMRQLTEEYAAEQEKTAGLYDALEAAEEAVAEAE